MSRKREDYAFWRARHRCPACHQQDEATKSGKAYCAACAAKYKRWNAAYYREHREAVIARQNGKTAQRRAEHRCTTCGAALPADTRWKRCDSCRAKNKAWRLVRKAGKCDARRPCGGSPCGIGQPHDGVRQSPAGFNSPAPPQKKGAKHAG